MSGIDIHLTKHFDCVVFVRVAERGYQMFLGDDGCHGKKSLEGKKKSLSMLIDKRPPGDQPRC